MKFIDAPYFAEIDAALLTPAQINELHALAQTDAHAAQARAEALEQEAIRRQLDAADAAEPKRDRRYLSRNGNARRRAQEIR